MYLYHYTNKRYIDNILKEGLNVKDDRNRHSRAYDTLPINRILDEYVPKDIPAFIDRDNCVFFHIEEQDMYDSEENERCIIVPINEIDLTRLYVFNEEDAHKIWCEVIDAPYSGQHIDEPLEIVAKRYWDSMMSYQEYLSKREIINYTVELLYFGEINPSIVSIKDKTKE